MGLRLKGLCFPRPLAVIIIEYNWTCPPSGRNLLSSILMSLAVDVGGNAGFLISASSGQLALACSLQRISHLSNSQEHFFLTRSV